MCKVVFIQSALFFVFIPSKKINHLLLNGEHVEISYCCIIYCNLLCGLLFWRAENAPRAHGVNVNWHLTLDASKRVTFKLSISFLYLMYKIKCINMLIWARIINRGNSVDFTVHILILMIKYNVVQFYLKNIMNVIFKMIS